MTEATIGYNTRIRIGRGAGPTWTTLAGVRDIEWPKTEADEHEVTAMDSPGRRKEFISGLIDSGEISIPLWWVPGSTTDVLLTDIAATGELVQVEFLANAEGATAETYVGFAKTYNRTSPVNGPQECDVTFRINGIVEAE